MALVFCDSFDHYVTFLQKWSSGVATFNTDLAFVRTGLQSLTATLPGFNNLPRVNFENRLTMICGFAYFPTSFGAEGNQISFWFNQASGEGYGEIDVLPNGSMVFKLGSSVFGTTPPGTLTTGIFSYIEAFATFAEDGMFIVRVNGQVVFNFVGSLWDGTNTGADGFVLVGSDVNDVYYDDFYLCDDTGGVNDNFLGAIQIFAILPDTDETPLQWTPLAGSNVSQVNKQPPPGDAAYVSSNTVGQIDQYHYPITGLPSSGFTIKAIQHSLCSRLDAAGAHTVNSQIGATTGITPNVGTDAPDADYAFVITPWDINPETGNPFLPADFATTFVGPKLTG